MGQKRNTKYDQAYARYCEGLSLSEVAAEMGVTRQSVFTAFNRRGFQLRTVEPNPEQEFDGKKFTLRPNGYYSLTVDDRCLMHRYVWQHYNGAIPDGYDIHHLNENKADNRIENLECLPKSEHTRKYSPHNNQFTRGRKRASYKPV